MRFRLVSIFLIIGLIISHQSVGAKSLAPILPGHEITLLEDGLELDWFVPPAQFSQDSPGRLEIKIEGFSQDNRPGALHLPVSGVLIAIPEEGEPVLEIVQLEVIPVSLPLSPAVNKNPIGVGNDAAGRIMGGVYPSITRQDHVKDSPIYLESAGVLRGVHLSRLVFHPVFLREGSFQSVNHIKIRLSYNVPNINQATASPEDPILATVRSMVINPQHVYAVDKPTPTTIRPTFLPEEKVAAIDVESTGLIAVTHDNLQAIGFPVGSVDPNRLHLMHAGSEIAYQWSGDDDSIFENQERLLFFAEPRFSRWTKTDTYILWQGETAGLRMDSRPANPTSLSAGVAEAEILIEANTTYTPDCYCAPIPAGRDGDRWVWQEMIRSASDGVVEYDFTFQLSSVNPSQTASLTLWLIGMTDLLIPLDHNVLVSVNGKSLGELTWDGKAAINETLPISPDTLLVGENTITLALPGMDGVDFEGAWLDAFELQYALGSDPGGENLLFIGEDTPHAYQVRLNSLTGMLGYDVTEPSLPIALTNLQVIEPNTVAIEDPDNEGGEHRYWLTTESGIDLPTHLRLLTPLQTGGDFSGVDYLIIAPASFIPALSELVSLREKQGLSVAIEDIQAIYDTFSDGRSDPAALQAYLTHAYEAGQSDRFMCCWWGTGHPIQNATKFRPLRHLSLLTWQMSILGPGKLLRIIAM